VVLFRVPASLSFAFLLSLCFSSLFCPLDSKFFANSFHLSKSHDPRHFFISPFSLQPTLLSSLFVSLYLTTTTYLDDKEEEEVKEKKI